MNSIESYIKKAQGMYGGKRRTKAYAFVEDGVILVRKPEKQFEELKNKIKYCKEQGVNIPAYISYKFDGEYYWILEELATGEELDTLVHTENITKIFGNMPYEYIEKYIRDVYLLNSNGIGVEPRRRNVFYDKEKGFTTIDVALLKETSKGDSLKEVSYFFAMFAPVCLPQFTDDEYGNAVKEKTILNIIKAFESGHPFFSKYKRWIYRENQEYAEYLTKQGVDLTLDNEECQMMINLIEELINNMVQEKIEHPETLFINRNCSDIKLLSKSISYYPNFNLFNSNEQTLEKYIQRKVYDKIKNYFLHDINNDTLRRLYFEIRRKELDPVSIYPEEYIYEQIETEIKDIITKSKSK